MKGPVSLEEYKRAERRLAVVEGRRGLLVHALISLAVAVGLVIINMLVAPEFPWSIFPAIGMSIGVGFHYLGIRGITRSVERHQDDVEFEAAQLSA